MNELPISKKAFWDIDFTTLDPERSALFIMQKVFNYGPWDDQIALLRYYGAERTQTRDGSRHLFKRACYQFFMYRVRVTKNRF